MPLIHQLPTDIAVQNPTACIFGHCAARPDWGQPARKPRRTGIVTYSRSACCGVRPPNILLRGCVQNDSLKTSGFATDPPTTYCADLVSIIIRRPGSPVNTRWRCTNGIREKPQ